MRHLVLPVSLLAFSTLPVFAQASVQDPSNFLPRYTVGVGYNNIRANAPPTNCGCFDMNGGFLSASYALKYSVNAVAEVTAGHANSIGPLGQDLTLTTYMAGPQVMFRWTRLTPYAQVMLGAAHGADSYFPNGNSYSTSATSFAVSAGAGVDYHLNHRFAIRLIEAQYLHTTLPNGSSNEQNHLMLGAGVILKFHGHYAQPVPEGPKPAVEAPPPPPPPPTPPPVVVPPPAALVPAPQLPAASVSPAEFHRGIRDIFFDYDSAALRADAQQGITDAVSFLQDHPELRVQVGGYSDERGTTAYNFALSLRRAEAARDALVRAGISDARIRAVSYGKSVEVCKEQDEDCWSRNRRAAFMPEP